MNTLRRYGLFDAKVPRYTSYPPANRFQVDTGLRNHAKWLRTVPPNAPVSVYVHIPFCRRLCWFCACRTQGTKTLGPIDAYIDAVIAELAQVRAALPEARAMLRLHLGGGTPTLLTANQMDRLLAAVHETFPMAPGFEFSVEVDPTEASDAVLACLARWSLSRASIGIQDFDPLVQQAIGRPQSVACTARVANRLREEGLNSLNFDLLYGLPHQSQTRLARTLDHVLDMRPDRLALYGYAHVPHVSKRQVMIDAHSLPGVEERFWLARRAADVLGAAGYLPLGIDHFALPSDSLSRARLRRNFQGYTDDPCETLIGIGASAISKFRQGYVQNAVATAAYSGRVSAGGLAGHKGYEMTAEDHLIARLIEALMCDFEINGPALAREMDVRLDQIEPYLTALTKAYPEAILCRDHVLSVRPPFRAATRIMAGAIDAGKIDGARHSIAV